MTYKFFIYIGIVLCNAITEMVFLVLLSMMIVVIFNGKLPINIHFDMINIDNLKYVFSCSLVLRLILQLILTKYSSYISIKFINVLRKKLLLNLLSSNFERTDFSKVIKENLTNLNTISIQIIPPLQALVSEFSIFLILAIYLSYKYGMISLLYLAIPIVLIVINSKKGGERGIKKTNSETSLSSFYEFLYWSRDSIRAFGKLDNINIKFDNLVRESSKISYAHSNQLNLSRLFTEFAVGLLILIVSFINLNNNYNPEFLIILLRLIPNINKLNFNASQIRYGLGIIGGLNYLKILYLVGDIRKNFIKLGNKDINIKFNKQNILYLKNKISTLPKCEFKKGEINFICGESGSGKSSFVYAMLGFYPYSLENGLYINGVKYEDLNCMSISYSSQFTNKINIPFKDYIYDFGNKDDRIENLLIDFGITVKDDENQDRLLGMSGGEISRVNFIKTICQESEIYIFDEPSANVDEKIFEKMNKYLTLLAKNKIVIVITHDNRFDLKEKNLVYLERF